MTRLLYIKCSPRNESDSSSVAEAFLAAYREAHPDAQIDTLDLWQTELPAFDGKMLGAKYGLPPGQSQDPSEVAAWKAVTGIIERFKTADCYLFSVPMWNFGIPYVLKHFIDIIVQPGHTFQFSPQEGFQGLVTGRPAVVICARGAAYSSAEGQALDFQKRYMDLILGFIGITDVRPILVEPTLGEPSTVENARTSAHEQARKLARELA